MLAKRKGSGSVVGHPPVNQEVTFHAWVVGSILSEQEAEPSHDSLSLLRFLFLSPPPFFSEINKK